jgi:hypothetical protein
MPLWKTNDTSQDLCDLSHDGLIENARIIVQKKCGFMTFVEQEVLRTLYNCALRGTPRASCSAFAMLCAISSNTMQHRDLLTQ